MPHPAPTRETPGPHEVNKIAATTFTFRELAGVTNNFREDCLLGEGGFGRVYKGRLENTGQVSAEQYWQLYFVFLIDLISPS